MSGYAIKLTTFGQHEAKNTTPNLGTVKGDKFATFTDLAGKTVRCTTGSLWITLENDVMDHVLRVDQSFTIPVTGKVIVGGRGCYSIDPGTRMPLAS
jgi:hypothetical protein